MAHWRLVLKVAAVILLLSGFAIAQIVYTPVNVSIPVNGSYHLDVNQDGIPDFTIRSQILQARCQYGNRYTWDLSISPGAGDAVVVTTSDYVTALLANASIDSDRSLSLNTALLTEFDWGQCETGVFGEWLNLPNRYLGLQFRLRASNDIHYGWAKVSAAAYLDQHGNLQTNTFLQGFAYQMAAGVPITAGER